MFAAAPPEIQAATRIGSGYRSPEIQAKLFADAVKKYGSEQAARKWVAPPGRSNHGHGGASDLKYTNPAAKQWWHENAKQYGLAFPLGHEDWHIESAGERDGHNHAPAPSTAQLVAGPQPAAFGDVVAPQPQQAPVLGPDLASLLAGRMQSIQARRETENAERQRRQQLFDTDALAALYS